MKLKSTTNILANLRDSMKRYLVQAYIVPTEDEHLGEYSSRQETRRSYITGFTGSRGVAIVTESSAALWTDGRYFQQAAIEIDNNWILMKDGLPETPDTIDWLRKELKRGSRIGVDPFVITASRWNVLSKKLANFDLELVDVLPNLVDEVWTRKPTRPSAFLTIQPLHLTGKSWVDKVRQVQKKVGEKSASAVVLTQLDDIAWLLNLRGNDIDYHPLFYSYVIVDQMRINLFIDEGRLDESVQRHLGLKHSQEDKVCVPVVLHSYSAVQAFLSQLASTEAGKIWISEESNKALYSCVPEKSRLNLSTPVAKMKAVKNPVEVEAMRWAHIKDAVSLCEFFLWLEKEVPSGNVTEISAADQLDKFKRQQENYMGRSFEFISSVGANASVIHYVPSSETDRVLNTEELYLCDTGAQFREGTTDVTRVLHFGTPSKFEVECFTRVLKGHIAISNIIFPEGTKGSRLDSFARSALWQVGLDYLHGTGHGVGSHLCVHEGPYGVNVRAIPDELPLMENMIISNEPGYYEDGKFGVRIENLVQIVTAKTEHKFKGKTFLTFDEVTLVPLQCKLVDPNILTEAEINWFNNYQTRCREVIGTELQRQKKDEVYEWLQRETQLI